MSRISNDVQESKPGIGNGVWVNIWLENLKLLIASSVVLFLTAIVVTGIANGWMVMKVPPVAGFIILGFVLTLMAYVEALHYSCVNLSGVDPAVFEQKYPRAAENQRLVNTPTLVKRFLLGRQGFVIAIVFVTAQLTTFPDFPDDLWGMPSGLCTLLGKTGLPGVALVLTVGQLISQIYVESYTIPFHNIRGCYSVINLALATEYIGLCHWSWLLYEVSNRLACIKIVRAKKAMDKVDFNADGEDMSLVSPTVRIRGADFDHGVPDTSQMSLFDAFRYLWSTCLSMSAIGVVIYGISTGTYILHIGVAGAYIVAIATLTLLFYLEGLMIAVAATTDWDREMWREAYPRAYAVHEMLNKTNQVKAFIIGRQFMTLLTGFILAEIFTFANMADTDEYADWLHYVIFKSGFAGVLLVLSIGQLVPELLAAEYPLRFLNMRGTYVICSLCLFFNGCGVGHAGWTIYHLTRGFACKGEVEKTEHSQDTISDADIGCVKKVSLLESAELFHKTGSPYGGPKRAAVQLSLRDSHA